MHASLGESKPHEPTQKGCLSRDPTETVASDHRRSESRALMKEPESKRQRETEPEREGERDIKTKRKPLNNPAETSTLQSEVVQRGNDIHQGPDRSC